MEEDSVRRLPGRFLAHYILEDFGRLLGSLLESLLKYNALEDGRLPRRLPISLPKSASDLENMYIKPRSEKPAYQKTFKWLKNRENE